jgi:hypothetical protein
MNIYAALVTIALGLLIVLYKFQTPAMAGRQAITVPALKKHTATIIMAHGLGDSGAGWVQLAENWRRRGKFEDVKFIFPNAPNIPITINMGMRMPGWYDIVRRREDVRSPPPVQPSQTHNIVARLLTYIPAPDLLQRPEPSSRRTRHPEIENNPHEHD